MPARARELWYRVIGKRAAARGAILPSRAGRFHGDPDREPTTYAADSLRTAWLEVSARFGAVPADPRGFSAWKLGVRGLKLADLTSAAERRRFGITVDQLLADPAPARCRELAADLRRPGAEWKGILYPSVRNRPGGVCLVVFLDRAPGLKVEPADDEWKEFIA